MFFKLSLGKGFLDGGRASGGQFLIGSDVIVDKVYGDNESEENDGIHEIPKIPVVLFAVQNDIADLEYNEEDQPNNEHGLIDNHCYFLLSNSQFFNPLIEY